MVGARMAVPGSGPNCFALPGLRGVQPRRHQVAQRLRGASSPQGLNAATTVYEVEAAPRVAVAVWGPAAVARMSSRLADALPFCTSTTYGTPWLAPARMLPGWPAVMVAPISRSLLGTLAVGPMLMAVVEPWPRPRRRAARRSPLRGSPRWPPAGRRRRWP